MSQSIRPKLTKTILGSFAKPLIFLIGLFVLRPILAADASLQFAKDYSLRAIVGSQDAFFSWGLEAALNLKKFESVLPHSLAPRVRYQQSLALRSQEQGQFFRATLPWLFFLEDTGVVVGPQFSTTILSGTGVPYFFTLGGRVSYEWFGVMGSLSAEAPLSSTQKAALFAAELSYVKKSGGQKYFDQMGLRYELSEYRYVRKTRNGQKDEQSWYAVLGVLF